MSKRRRLGRSAFVLAIALGLLAVITQRGGDKRLYPATGSEPALNVYVSYNFFHSDLLVPRHFSAEGTGPSAIAVRGISARGWVALGWGDANFYQGHGFGPERALALFRSAFWPRNPSVVRLSDDDPRHGAPGWSLLKLHLSTTGARQLRRRLDASFATKAGQPIATSGARGPALPPTRFFTSTENAWAFHVCNHWTAELLNAAGVPITPVLDLTSPGLAADLRLRAGAALVAPLSP